MVKKSDLLSCVLQVTVRLLGCKLLLFNCRKIQKAHHWPWCLQLLRCFQILQGIVLIQNMPTPFEQQQFWDKKNMKSPFYQIIQLLLPLSDISETSFSSQALYDATKNNLSVAMFICPDTPFE